MKTVFHKFRVGDLVWGQVVEIVDSYEMIVSFQGDLTRVRNESLRKFSMNEKVLMRVVVANPLTLQPVSADDKKRGATRINVTV